MNTNHLSMLDEKTIVEIKRHIESAKSDTNMTAFIKNMNDASDLVASLITDEDGKVSADQPNNETNTNLFIKTKHGNKFPTSIDKKTFLKGYNTRFAIFIKEVWDENTSKNKNENVIKDIERVFYTQKMISKACNEDISTYQTLLWLTRRVSQCFEKKQATEFILKRLATTAYSIFFIDKNTETFKFYAQIAAKYIK